MSDHGSPKIHTNYLEYEEAGHVMEGFVARVGSDRGKRPCILIAHDWSGQNDPIRRVAERIAALGYVAFALDVYGKAVRGSAIGDNAALMQPLMEDRHSLRQRLLAAFSVARQLPGVAAAKIAAIGYCFGGLCALDLARAAPEGLLGAVSIHGALLPPPLSRERPITAKILILHGWADPVVPHAEVLAAATEFTEAGADWQLHVYGHARHAFTFRGANVPEHGILYDAKADQRSWRAMLSFFDELFA